MKSVNLHHTVVFPYKYGAISEIFKNQNSFMDCYLLNVFSNRAFSGFFWNCIPDCLSDPTLASDILFCKLLNVLSSEEMHHDSMLYKSVNDIDN